MYTTSAPEPVCTQHRRTSPCAYNIGARTRPRPVCTTSAPELGPSPCVYNVDARARLFTELRELRDKRFLSTQEADGQHEVVAVWLNLSDKTTEWSCRWLYMDSVTVRLPSLFSASSNNRLRLSACDGGGRRRGIGVNFPVSFREEPEGPYEKAALSDVIKRSVWFTQSRRACYLWPRNCSNCS